MGRSRFISLLAKKSPRLSRKRTDEIYELAHLSVGITEEEEAAFFEIKLLLDKLEGLNKNIVKVNAKVESIGRRYPLS